MPGSSIVDHGVTIQWSVRCPIARADPRRHFPHDGFQAAEVGNGIADSLAELYDLQVVRTGESFLIGPRMASRLAAAKRILDAPRTAPLELVVVLTEDEGLARLGEGREGLSVKSVGLAGGRSSKATYAVAAATEIAPLIDRLLV